ncbi:fatty acid/sphingolipid desaturase [Trichodelitschia bisporula]|uniref:Delta 8-(E)-sphingolipid desaturase n=1 Tax=Trichodelitschia bisporula TaxID=703511 RepID=A0A6G1I3G0_9PEZI|nr:fatty acid/sphingolipid desaturase [Trichodelitschia bisporula]
MPPPAPHRSLPVLPRREIEALIADGHAIIILDSYVLKADAWRPFHPGGDKAILHMVGRDATDEVNALHSPEARQRMNSYKIGRVEGRWVNFVPPIQGGKFRPRDVEVVDEGVEAESASSQDPSPVFDPVDPSSELRQRKGGYSRSSSISSVALDEDSRMSHIDVWTREEIKLDKSMYPPLEPEVQDDIVRKYRELGQRIKDAGLYQCNYTDYLIECTRYTLLLASCLYFLNIGWYKTSAAFLGMFWHQLVFSAHDAGHMGITHSFTLDTIIGIVIADYLGGLSLGWWKHNHNVHHIVTNSPDHDPDIQHMPFFAVSHRFLLSLRSTYYDKIMTYDAVARVTLRAQHYLYYPVLLFGRFNLYRLSWVYLLGGQAPKRGPAWWHRWFEITGHVFFWTWFGYGILYRSLPDNSTRLTYLLISHMVTMPVHAQITLSHFAMSTADLGPSESFVQKMLRTTMDIECPPWLDFFHGGLQFQAVHHLFPRIPRHNLRRTQALVQEFCKEVGIPYALYGFVEGNGRVIGRLGDVARQAKILAECKRVSVEKGEVPL